jgi:2-keto-4-pentenoate hydratase/2-oxohepta-3-ene-1,7-dioic acid hydratase in catechol pathway
VDSGKNGDHSGPLGPIVPAAEVGDLRDGLRVQTRVNGEIVQDGRTDEMVYTVGDTLSLISQTFTLRPGDLLATGTASGVGYSRTPPWLLHPGDVVEVEVDRLGVLRNTLVANAARRHDVSAKLARSPS